MRLFKNIKVVQGENIMVHNPGGKVNLKLSDDIVGDAIFGGENNCYRYSLLRLWDMTKKTAMFIMMNPSTADSLIDDPTIAKITRMVKKWNEFGSLFVGNTFAYRATDQNKLLEIDDPVGQENDIFLMKMAKVSSLIVFAYGTPKHKSLQYRGIEVCNMIKNAGYDAYALKLSKHGIPYHPLYLPENTVPFKWEIPQYDAT